MWLPTRIGFLVISHTDIIHIAISLQQINGIVGEKLRLIATALQCQHPCFNFHFQGLMIFFQFYHSCGYLVIIVFIIVFFLKGIFG